MACKALTVGVFLKYTEKGGKQVLDRSDGDLAFPEQFPVLNRARSIKNAQKGLPNLLLGRAPHNSE
jgi:hypothetical protein